MQLCEPYCIGMTSLEERPILVWVCLACTLTTVALTTHHFIYHFVIYRRGDARPSLQKLYTRILLVPPIYSACSWLALVFTDHAGIFDAVRGIYEAYALYCFAALMVLYAGKRIVVPLPTRYLTLRRPDAPSRAQAARPRSWRRLSVTRRSARSATCAPAFPPAAPSAPAAAR